MIYKVGLLGATGRMGSEITSLLSNGYSLGIDQLELSYSISKNRRTEPSAEPVNVWIDFSRPEATLALLETTQEPIVIGTTGFSSSELERIRDCSKKRPILLTANTSPGMNLMMQMLQHSSTTAKLGYDVVASELHHRHKKDSPSGTLKVLLKILEENGNRNIQVQSARVGDEKGTHTISFFSEDEELTLIHRVNNRRVFAKGALLAAHFMARQKKPGLYSFQDLEAT